MNKSALVFSILISIVAPTVAAEPKPLDLTPIKLPGLIHTAVGVTREGRAIPAVLTSDDLDLNVQKMRILLVAGLDGSRLTPEVAMNVVRRFYTLDEFAPLRKTIVLSSIVCGNPDGYARDLRHSNGAGGDPARGYPPTGEHYTSATNSESQYIWRWIGMHAPDIVIDLTEDDERRPAPKSLDHLAEQLDLGKPSNVGSIKAIEWKIHRGEMTPFADIGHDLLKERHLPEFRMDKDASAARRELIARVKRSPREVAEQLAKVYGQDLPTVQYIPAMALVGRLRLGELTGDASHRGDVERIVSPFLSGDKPALSAKSGGSEFAGHWVFGSLYDATKNNDYVRLVKAVADRAFDEQGRPREAMPSHSEMSDAVFMACPVLALAGRLTLEAKYNDMCLRHMRFMNKLNVRADGLHRHSPLDESAWGRGNGFPALGLALALSELPKDFAGRDEMIAAWKAHLDALLKHQDPTGAWHQVVDRPESYRELTATCMICFAMMRGVRLGILPRDRYAAAIDRAWQAIKTRVASDGSLVDVCTGTGKQRSLRDYYDRGAILGRDGRGGAMALLVATERMAYQP